MSLSDHKISAYGTSISALEDKPKLSAAELKALFDSRTDKEVKQAINGLIEALMAAEAAEELGATDPETGEPGTVQGVMSALHEAVQERMQAANAYTREETEDEIDRQIQEKMTEIGAGDMMRAVYDPQSVRRDVFEAIGEAVSAAEAAQAAADSAAEAAGTAGSAAQAAQSTADSKAPKAHASTATTYGIGTGSNYGHIKLSDSITSTSAASAGIAASPKAVKTVNDKVGDSWTDVSSQYSCTCSNSKITVSELKVYKRGIRYHMRLSITSSAAISVGTKLTFTLTGGVLPKFYYNVPCYSDETIAICIFNDAGEANARILCKEWPANYNLQFSFEYTG